ncbi:MAG: hypothetical protein ACR2RE_28865, partial [Geminicoccaceae bacterium]
PQRRVGRGLDSQDRMDLQHVRDDSRSELKMDERGRLPERIGQNFVLMVQDVGRGYSIRAL